MVMVVRLLPGDPNSNGWIVQITLGTKGASKNSTIVLKYNDVTVQRSLATDPTTQIASIETFSGPDTTAGLPQFPVEEAGKGYHRSETRSRWFWCGHVHV